MTDLCRTRVGPFREEDALTIAQVSEMKERLTDILIPVDRVFEDLPEVTVKAGFEKMARNGNQIPEKGLFCASGDLNSGVQFRLYDTTGDFIGVYHIDSSGQRACPVKMFY